MTKIDLLQYLTKMAKEYRKDCVNSVNRNKHMNELCGNFTLDQNSIDAILTDFVNKIGMHQGVDYAMYTEDLRKE
jgi:hypothetical protein